MRYEQIISALVAIAALACVVGIGWNILMDPPPRRRKDPADRAVRMRKFRRKEYASAQRGDFP